jgi:FkbM family methyltransferase
MCCARFSNRGRDGVEKPSREGLIRTECVKGTPVRQPFGGEGNRAHRRLRGTFAIDHLERRAVHGEDARQRVIVNAVAEPNASLIPLIVDSQSGRRKTASLVGFLNIGKRALRIAAKTPLPLHTRWRLLLVEFLRRPFCVPLGDHTLELDASTLYIDYVTLYGLLIDEHFSLNFDGAAVVDVGAHKGYYGGLALFHGATRVFSYEPERQNFAALNRTANTARWSVEHCAIGPHGGMVDLHISSNSWSHSIYAPETGTVTGRQTVMTRPLADVLERARNGDRIVCKINVEGAAGEVVRATDANDWADVSDLWCDFEPSDPVPVTETIEHLERAGFRVSERDGRRLLFRRR